MTAVDIIEQKRQRNLQRLRLLRPIDDDFMRCMFKDNIPLAQLVLRIITGKPDLVITSCQTQKDMRRLAGARSLCLDAYGTDSTGKKYDLEIQRADKGAGPHRARYHSSVMDVENLDAGQDFEELPDTYTIFIVEKDFYGLGKPVYAIERMNLDTGKPFEDGEHIIYVNGEYRGDSDIGKLMHDFNCTDAADMKLPLMAEQTRYLKENQKGVSGMCKILEEMVQEERAEAAEATMKKVALRLLKDRTIPLTKIADTTELSLEELEELRKTVDKEAD
ncbi:MAG: hypothetical protein HFF14_08040 [Angelakisella sp.]|jgi:hypothetical protein|nr:hypothetical protein [Angelakisella sp.]